MPYFLSLLQNIKHQPHFFLVPFSDSWMLPKLVAFYSLHRTCTRSRQNLPCYADRMVGMHNAYLPTCRGLGVGTMFLFLNPLTYLCSGSQGCARLIFFGLTRLRLIWQSRWLNSDSTQIPNPKFTNLTQLWLNSFWVRVELNLTHDSSHFT